MRLQSALPYNVTTGRDDNGDTVSNDRPAGVTRNIGAAARKRHWRASVLVDRVRHKASGGGGGPQVRIVRAAAMPTR